MKWWRRKREKPLTRAGVEEILSRLLERVHFGGIQYVRESKWLEEHKRYHTKAQECHAARIVLDQLRREARERGEPCDIVAADAVKALNLRRYGHWGDDQ